MTTLEFSYLLTQSSSKLRAYAYRLTSNVEESQDLLQETFLKALKYKNKFQDGSNFSAWLHTIMKNTFINQYRRTKKRIVSKDESEFQYTQSNALSDNTSDQDILHQEILTEVYLLDEKYRVPFIMICDGYKYHEIAEELNLPVGTIKSRIFAARSILSTKFLHHQQ